MNLPLPTDERILYLATLFLKGHDAEQAQGAELLNLLEDDGQRALLFQRDPTLAQRYEGKSRTEMEELHRIGAIAIGVVYAVRIALDEHTSAIH